MVFLTAELAMKRPGFGFNRRYKNGRAPFKPEEYMGLVERTPMRLRNYVRTAQTRKDDLACISEMMTLFNCMKVNEYSEKECPQELAAFQACYSDFREKIRDKIAIEDPREPTPYSRNLSNKQLNELLSRYPQRVDM